MDYLSSMIQGGHGGNPSLRDECVALFSIVARMRCYTRRELAWRYQSCFGNERLTNFVLSVNLAELREWKRRTNEKTDIIPKIYRQTDSLHLLDRAFVRRIEESAVELLMLPFRESIPDSRQVYLTQLLAETLPYCWPLVSKSPEAVISDVGTAIELYSDGNADGLIELRARGEEALSHATTHTATDNHALRQEIARLFSELEEMELSYPFLLRYKLYDDEWIEGEHQRLRRERDELRKLIDDLRR